MFHNHLYRYSKWIMDSIVFTPLYSLCLTLSLCLFALCIVCVFFVQFLARLTKLSWFDVQKNELVFRTIVDDVGKFLQVTLYIIFIDTAKGMLHQ